MPLSRLEKLPQEIRDHIYHYIFPCDEILTPGVHTTCGPNDKPLPSLAMLQVNRQIATEAAKVLFERNRCQIRIPPTHRCSLGRCTNKNGCTEMRLGKPIEDDNHSCMELGCLRGHKQRHLAQRWLQRYGHQVQHVHLAMNSIDLLYGVPNLWTAGLLIKSHASVLSEDHELCHSSSAFRNCRKIYIGWIWEGRALRTIASTGLKSMILDLGTLCWDVCYLEGIEEIQRRRKKSFMGLMQDLFRGLKVRQVTFQQFMMDRDAVAVWLNTGFDIEEGSGWIESLTVIGLPLQEDIATFLAGLKQEGYRAAESSTGAASLPKILALSNVTEYDEINTWLK